MNVTFKATGPRKPARGDRQRHSSRRDSNGKASKPSANNAVDFKQASVKNKTKRVSFATKEASRKEFLLPTRERIERHLQCKKSESNQRTALWVQSQLNERIVSPVVEEQRAPSATPFLDNYLHHYGGQHTCNRHKWNAVRVPAKNYEKEVVTKKPNRAHGLHNQRIKNWDQSSTRRIGRSSSPAPHYCYHCEHDHRRDCCLQPGDSNDDIAGFADWISELETREAKPAPFLDIPETVSGSISPPWFPKCLPVPPKKIHNEQHVPACSAMPPMAHQCFVPVYGPNVRVVPLSSYQQFSTPEGFVYLVPQVQAPPGAFNQFMQQYYHVPQVYLVQPKPCAKPCPVHTWIPGMYMQPPTYPATHLLQQLTHQYCSSQC